jgi:putative nucleotidyltransferase with HDIG domain
LDSAIRRSAQAALRIVPPGSDTWVSVLNAVLLVGLLVAVFTVRLNASSMRVGQVADSTLVAQRTVSFSDRVLTAAARKKAIRAIPAVYKADTSSARERRREASSFLQAAAPISSSGGTVPAKLTLMRRMLPAGLDPGALQQIAAIGGRNFPYVTEKSLALLAQAEAWRFNPNQVTSYEAALLSTIPPRVPAQSRTAVGEILATFLYPTLVLDITATEQEQRKAAAAVPTAVSTVYSGQVVVRRGDIVTPAMMERLAALGLQNRHTQWQDVAGSLLFAILIVVTLFWYLLAFHPSLSSNPRLLVLIDASIMCTVVGARLLAENHVLLPFFLPVAAASTFAAALIAPEACVAVTLAMAVLAGWVVANSFELTMYYFLTGAAGVLAIRQVRQLKQFIFAGVYVTGFALITVLAFGFVDRVYDFSALQGYVLASVFNGFVSSALALGAFALLSSFFGVTTSLQLLELGQPSHPLLRRLMVRAPGTYNHSLILANMVEHAAEEIGANSLAAKLGALYHDVGKSVNPHCFVENQLGMGNIHDDMRAEESARIIRGHVSAGMRMARQHRLPRLVLDAIAEHHGTMAIGYFLRKAQSESPDAPVDVSMYSYAGPRPQSKETALLMLADACESATRASLDHSSEKIAVTVHRIFWDRIESGQLDECPLTLRDIDLTEHAFRAVLNGLYHPRIEYPEAVERGLEIESELRLTGHSGKV